MPPQMVACVGCVWLKLDIVVTAAISYDENTSQIRDSGCCRLVSQTSRYPRGQAKSGKGVLNTRRNSGEARLSGLCYLWGLEGRGFPIRRL